MISERLYKKLSLAHWNLVNLTLAEVFVKGKVIMLVRHNHDLHENFTLTYYDSRSSEKNIRVSKLQPTMYNFLTDKFRDLENSSPAAKDLTKHLEDSL